MALTTPPPKRLDIPHDGQFHVEIRFDDTFTEITFCNKLVIMDDEIVIYRDAANEVYRIMKGKLRYIKSRYVEQ